VPCCRPSPHWAVEENGKKQAETVGRDKGSLTEQQTKGTAKTTIQIRRKHNTNHKTQRAPLHDRCLRSRTASEFPPPASPHRNTA